MYVHKNHVRSWVVHTFNLKRLDRENMGSSTAAIKRTYEQSTHEEEASCSSNGQQNEAKRICTEDADEPENNLPDKRLSKPVKRFDSEKKEGICIYPKER